MQSDQSPGNRRLLPAIVAFCSIIAVGFACYGSLLGLGLVGWDTYPLILTARVESAADVVTAFTTELMAGRYPLGEFYRPLATLTLALDWKLWGLDSFGYHLSDLFVMLGAAGAVFLVARRFFGYGWLPVLAALFFVLHPAHFEALPVTARRPDYLSLLFCLLAVVALPRPGANILSRRGWLTAALTLCSLFSKETGLVTLGLLFVVALAEAPGSLGARILDSLRRIVLPAVALTAYLLVRYWVLGGIGGHEQTGILAAFGRMTEIISTYGALLIMPQPIFGTPDIDGLFIILAAASLIVGAAFLSIRPPPSSSHSLENSKSKSQVPSPALILTVCAAWFLGLVYVSAVSGDRQAWYVVPFLPVHALVFAFVAVGATRFVLARRWRVAGPLVAIVLLVGVGHLWHSGLFHKYGEWQRISDESQRFLELVDKKTAISSPGQVVLVYGLPEWIVRNPGSVAPRAAAGMANYSVQAWMDLVHPERPVQILYATSNLAAMAKADAIVVAVVPAPHNR